MSFLWVYGISSLLPFPSEGMELWALCSCRVPNSGVQHSALIAFFPPDVRNAHSGSCQIKHSPAVSEESKQALSPEGV